MKYLNKKIISLILVIVFCILFITVLPVSKIKELSFKDFLTSQAINIIDKNIKNNIRHRDWIIKIKNKYDRITLKKENNNVYYGKDNYLIKRYKDTVDINKASKKLNDFYNKINYVNTNLILVPSSTTIYKNKLPLFAYNDSEEKTISSIYNNIVFNKIDVSKILKNNTSKYQIYYKTDTNWTVYGAYYAYYEYVKQNNIIPYELSNFDIETVASTFKGNLYNSIEYTRYLDKMHMFYLNNSSYTASDNNKLYDINKLNDNYMYEYYLGNNEPIKTIINNTSNNDKELVLIADSLGNSIIPFLINHYKKIYFINPISYKEKISDLILNNPKINDCIILFNINNLTNKEINSIN